MRRRVTAIQVKWSVEQRINELKKKPNHKSSGLNKKDSQVLVDLLRKNILYQTPKPIFSNIEDEHPTHVEMRFVFAHHLRVLKLIHKAGGWVLPEHAKVEIMKRHEQAARLAYGDGADYDLSHLSYGDMVAMFNELEGISEMSEFRQALEEGIHDMDRDPNA